MASKQNQANQNAAPSGDATTQSGSANAQSGVGKASSGAQSGSSAPSGESHSGSMLGDAKNKAEQMAGQAQHKTKQEVQSGLTKGKNQAADALGNVAQSLRNSTQQMRDQNQHGASQYVDRAANQIQHFSDYLKNTDVTQIAHRVEQAARNQPAVFLGGAFAIGLLGARFLKSSHRDLQQQQRTEQWRGTARTGDHSNYNSSYDTMYGDRSYGGGTYGGERDVTDDYIIAVEVPVTGSAADRIDRP